MVYSWPWWLVRAAGDDTAGAAWDDAAFEGNGECPENGFHRVVQRGGLSTHAPWTHLALRALTTLRALTGHPSPSGQPTATQSHDPAAPPGSGTRRHPDGIGRPVTPTQHNHHRNRPITTGSISKFATRNVEVRTSIHPELLSVFVAN